MELYNGFINLLGERIIKLTIKASSKEKAEKALNDRADIISKRENKEVFDSWVEEFQPDIITF